MWTCRGIGCATNGGPLHAGPRIVILIVQYELNARSVSSAKTSAGLQRRSRPAAPHQFIERLAVALETDGFPRIAGRVFALLMISDSELSLDEIAEAIDASKASASVNTRLLEDKALIERVSRSGDRRDYYRISANLFACTMEQRLARWDRVRSVVGEGMKDASLSAPARSRLREFDSASEAVRDVLQSALLKLRNRGKR